MSRFSKTSPRSIELPYQTRWVDDGARFKIGLMARQTGKDFSSAGEIVRDVLETERGGGKTTWLIGAPSERQSLETAIKCREWAEAYRLSLEEFVERQTVEALMTSSTMTFPNGSRIIAVPGRPDTVRGFSANVLLTEFAFFEDPDATWRAIYPSISNPLRGGLKKIRLISTPNGVGNKFHSIWTENYQVAAPKWSCHRVTIHDAVAAGLPVDVSELRAGLNDPEGWAQEYECEFMDTSSVLLPYEIIAPCESATAAIAAAPELWEVRRCASPLYIGIDFGRRHDLTVAWSLEDPGSNGSHLITRDVLSIGKTPTDTQLDILRPRIRRARRVCFDYTGPGIGLGDLLVREFGHYAPKEHKFGKIELVTFTNEVKLSVFPTLRVAFDQRRLSIPVDRRLREDLHSLYRVATKTGGITYRAPHTADGHADAATALALAVRAADAGRRAGAIDDQAVHAISIGKSRFRPTRL